MILISFSQKIKEDMLVASARHCCVCHRYKGVKVEVHHIIPVDKGGEDTFENGIALCFDCHSDAGHYYAKHPRGTKFSPTELKKHKVTWNKIVKENNIPEYRGVNLIHTVYYVTKNSEVIHEIVNSNLSRFPLKDAIVHINDILRFQKHFLRDYESEPGFKRINDYPVEEAKNYLLKYPDAVEADENDYPNYLFIRTPKKEEVEDFCKKDRISRFLLKTGEDIKNIFKIFAYIDECGNPCLQEILIKRSIWACYLCITNISNYYLNVDSINYKGNSPANNRMPFGELIKNNREFKLSLPKMQIAPGKSILIPFLTLLAPFQGDDVEEYSSIEQELNYSEEAQFLSYGKLHKMENSSNFLVLGPGINPVSVNIFKDKKTSLQEIHRFDFSNLYLIDRMWMCGCCPYIFFKKENRTKYFCEVFQKAPDMIQYFKITAPKDVSSFILCELEYETTVISFIKINGRIIFQNKKLVKGESLKFKVNEGDIIEGSGFYTLSFKNIQQESPNRKNDLIKKFIMSNNYS